MFGDVSFLSKKRGRDPLLRTKVGRGRHSRKKVAVSGRAGGEDGCCRGLSKKWPCSGCGGGGLWEWLVRG